MIMNPNFIWLVTVKLAKNPDHNPHKKQSGPCPVNGKPCTDTTGEHHTVADFTSKTEEQVRKVFAGFHITRIEKA